MTLTVLLQVEASDSCQSGFDILEQRGVALLDVGSSFRAEECDALDYCLTFPSGVVRWLTIGIGHFGVVQSDVFQH